MSNIESPAVVPNGRMATWTLLGGSLVLALLPWLSALYRDGPLAESPRELLTSVGASLVSRSRASGSQKAICRDL